MELPCRARKKKCYHYEDNDRDQAPHPAPVITRESTPRRGRINNYNPEIVLAELSKGSGPVARVEQPDPKAILSSWPGGLSQISAERPTTSQKQQRQLDWYQRHRREEPPTSISESQRAYLLEVGALLVLPKATVDALLPIYVSSLDDLLPIVNGARVFREYSNGQCSVHLIKAICLVTSKAKQAAPFLRLNDTGAVLEPLDFAHAILVGLDAAMKADLELDRVIKIQILALMHLHNDGTGRMSGMDRSSRHLSQAISEAWALSLHWKIPGNTDQEQCDYLWWTLRNLDRLNKPIQGAAPFIIDDTDIAIKRIQPTDGSHRSQVMGMSLKMGDLMTIATKGYKATSTATRDADFEMIPPFDAVTSQSSFAEFHSGHRAYLEIWYHIAAMLSCKHSEAGSRHYDRRLTSAKRILTIVSYEAIDGLPPLPLVPYATSLATTMIYQAFRDGQRDTDATHQDLKNCCNVLDTLCQRWTSARGVAKLARRLLKVLRHSKSVCKRQEVPVEGTHPTPVSLATAPGHDRINGSTQTLGTISSISTPMPFQNEDIQSINASYTRLDRAFGELFDFNMPNVFRDHTTWETLLSHDEESSTSGDLQLPTYFSPEMDFGYSVIHDSGLSAPETL